MFSGKEGLRLAAVVAVVVLWALSGGASAQTSPRPGSGAPAPGNVSPETKGLPPFLPSYYWPAFAIAGQELQLTKQSEEDKLSSYTYSSADHVVSLSVENYRCDSSTCDVIYANALKYFNAQVTKSGGQFSVVTNTEFRADWKTGLGRSHIFVFKHPRSLMAWNYGTRLKMEFNFDVRYAELLSFVNRQRYEEVLPEGNVEMGRWGRQIREYATDLLKEKKKPEALTVLKNLLATSPTDFEAQMIFVANTSDGAAAKNSAQTVLANAEDPVLVAKAARFLGQEEPDIASLPILDAGEKGLQLILIPLPPCNIRLVAEAAKVYEKITDVPTKIMRLAEDWHFSAPDRIPDQKQIQQAIIDHNGPSVNFAGWTIDQYKAELLKTVETKDALIKFGTEEFTNKLYDRPAQYLIDPYLENFSDIIAKHRSNDIRTMYVGVTKNNIYSGDANFVFSTSLNRNGTIVSILSYSMMLAKTLDQPFESRRRLIERIAKEMVPASLKALNIPRPVDPSDPYSYSSGVDRLDQKGLLLSAPVKEALHKFR